MNVQSVWIGATAKRSIVQYGVNSKSSIEGIIGEDRLWLLLHMESDKEGDIRCDEECGKGDGAGAGGAHGGFVVCSGVMIW
jgi:hypothetical protein